jgi:hypothetical protein
MEYEDAKGTLAQLQMDYSDLFVDRNLRALHERAPNRTPDLSS